MDPLTERELRILTIALLALREEIQDLPRILRVVEEEEITALLTKINDVSAD